MNYCYECGTRLEKRMLENEGLIPFCPHCETFRFPIFSTAVSMIVHNPRKDKILLIQQYGKKTNVLVAGYVNQGESAEETVIREVYEETGLHVISLCFNKSEYFQRSNTLMLNYTCVTDSEDLSRLNTREVDQAQWFSHDDARAAIRPDSLAQKFLLFYLDKLSSPSAVSTETRYPL